MVFAEENLETTTQLIIRNIRMISIVLGALIMIFGILKVAIARQKEGEGGKLENKAFVLMLVGLILILFGSIVLSENMGWIYTGIET